MQVLDIHDGRNQNQDCLMCFLSLFFLFFFFYFLSDSLILSCFLLYEPVLDHRMTN